MSGFLLACVAAAIVVALLVVWHVFIYRVEMEQWRWPLSATAATGIALAVVALAREPGIVGGVLAGTSILLAVGFLALGALAGQSKQALAVAVGGRLLDFTAPDESGKPFALASLRGHPILIKFFRGHW